MHRYHHQLNFDLTIHLQTRLQYVICYELLGRSDAESDALAEMHKREIVEAVTILETPPIVVCGVVGYVETPRGLRSLTTVWAEHLSDELKRRFYKSWYNSKKKAFTKYAKKHAESNGQNVARELERIRKYCTVVRVLAHTQIRKTGLKQKKAHLMEIQVNGGSIADKVDFAKNHFEKPVEVGSVFEQDENVGYTSLACHGSDLLG